MLALANPDPSLAFPEGTVLLPQLFIRNVTSKPVEAVLAFNWRMDTSTGKAFGPALHLNPLETRRIDVAALQDGKTLPQNAQWSSVMLTTNALPGEVVAVAASYDKSLRYGAQTPFSDQLASHWAASQWQYDPQHDSVITVGNGGTKPTRAAFTIFYNQGTQKYQLEQTLQPDEQMWIDVGKLIRESIHDKNGKPLPADLTSGSYEIWDLTHRGIGTLFEGKVIYDKTYGHVTYGCTLCCGFQRLARFSSPLYIPINGTSSDGVKGLDSCSQLYSDISSDFDGNWTTVNPSVTTVDCCGTFTGQGAGSTTSSTFADEPWHVSNYSCPIMNRNSQGNDNVTPAISGPNTVWYFSNLTVSGYATSIQLTSSGGSSTTWNITAGTGEITVSSFTGASINVLSSGTAFSSSVGDVKLTATTNGQTSAPYSLTTRTPNRLVPGAINNICDGHGGYLTTLGYTIQDQLMTPLPSAVPLNENWTTGVFKDYTGTNWTFPVPGFGTTQAPNFAFFADAISADENQNPPIPAYTCDGDSTPVEHIGQEWRIGSLATGTGRRVQTDTLQRYKGRAVHLSIVSPAP